MYFGMTTNRWMLGLLLVSCLANLSPAAAADFKVPNMNDRIQLSPEKSTHMMDSLRKMDELFDKAEQGNKNNRNDCDFHCPEGSRAMAKPKHKVYPDGCGSPDNKLDFPTVPEIDKCCDNHDICYGTFGEKKKSCDQHLHKCLELSCKFAMKSLGYKGSKEQGCKLMSKLLLGSVMDSSCIDYKKSQEKATLCQIGDEKQEAPDNNSVLKDNVEQSDTMSVHLEEDDYDFVTIEVEDPNVVEDEDVINLENNFIPKDEL